MRVLVLGAGYAGVTVARRLERGLPSSVELVVVDDDGEHLLRHEVHRLIRRPSLVDELVLPLEDILDPATTVRRGRVESVEPAEQRVWLANGESLDYDYAAVCLGSTTAHYDLPGLREHSLPLTGRADARRIRGAALDVIGTGGQIVVGGAGLSGVQAAGELSALADEHDALDAVQIVLLERLETVAPGFAPAFRAAIREELEARTVDVRTGTVVTGASAAGVETDAGPVAADCVVWTGGIRGPSALGGERIEVRDTLEFGTGTFVVGDAARVIDRDGEAVPATAQAAIREGRIAARNIQRLVDRAVGGDGVFEPRLDRLAFEPRGWIVSIGDGAVAQLGPAVVRGPAALALKTSVGLGYLSSVKSVRRAVERVVTEFGGHSNGNR